MFPQVKSPNFVAHSNDINLRFKAMHILQGRVFKSSYITFLNTFKASFSSMSFFIHYIFMYSLYCHVVLQGMKVKIQGWFTWLSQVRETKTRFHIVQFNIISNVPNGSLKQRIIWFANTVQTKLEWYFDKPIYHLLLKLLL